MLGKRSPRTGSAAGPTIQANDYGDGALGDVDDDDATQLLAPTEAEPVPAPHWWTVRWLNATVAETAQPGASPPPAKAPEPPAAAAASKPPRRPRDVCAPAGNPYRVLLAVLLALASAGNYFCFDLPAGAEEAFKRVRVRGVGGTWGEL